MNKKADRLRELKAESADMDDFVKKAADRGMIVSFAEGRRIWQTLKPKIKKDA